MRDSQFITGNGLLENKLFEYENTSKVSRYIPKFKIFLSFKEACESLTNPQIKIAAYDTN